MTATLDATRVEGAQRPRIFSAPEAASYQRADNALEFIAACRIVLDPWQRLCVRTALAEAADGRWAAFEFALFVARQNGKGEIIMALELAKLYLFKDGRPPLILHSAHLFPTAQEAFRRIRDVIDGSDMLRKEVKRISAAHGDEGIELRDGARLRFMARTVSGAGRGFSPTDLFFDEVFRLPIEAVAANLPALSAQRNPQIGYFASVGYPDSAVQWSLVERGRKGEDSSLAYLEWSASPEASLDDQAAWIDANPALGYRISLEHIRRERLALPGEEFARERLSKWADLPDEIVIPARAWAARATARGKPDGRVAFAVSATWPHAAQGCITVAGRLGSAMVVQVVDRRQGTHWIPARMRELQDQYKPTATLLDDKDPVAREKAGLEAAGVALTTVNSVQAGQAAAMFYAAVCGDEPYLLHFGQPELDNAVAGATKRPLGDAWTWARQGPVDISPLVGATFAVWAVAALESAPFFASWR